MAYIAKGGQSSRGGQDGSLGCYIRVVDVEWMLLVKMKVGCVLLIWLAAY